MPKTILTPPTFDQATIDHYVAKASRERSRALRDMVASIFRRSETTAPAARTAKAGCPA